MPTPIKTTVKTLLAKVSKVNDPQQLLRTMLVGFCTEDSSFLALMRGIVAKGISLKIKTIDGPVVFIAGQKVINLHPDIVTMLEKSNAGELKLNAERTLKLMLTHEGQHVLHTRYDRPFLQAKHSN